jgi:hypothetical protein
MAWRRSLVRNPSLFDPTNGRVGFVELKARHVDQGLSQPFDGIPHFDQADAGIHESKAVFILQEQAMADHP